MRIAGGIVLALVATIVGARGAFWFGLAGVT